MTTEHTPANGTLNDEEVEQLFRCAVQHNLSNSDQYSFDDMKRDIDAMLAKRPASWNAEQIRAAAARNSIWSGTAEMIVACLVEQHTPKPKTAEERVTKVLEYEFNENLPVTYSEVAAKIVAALKESEAYNG